MAGAVNDDKYKNACVDKFCPVGRYCKELLVVKCKSPPCQPILACVQKEDNGCNIHPPCPPGEVCTERTVPCISRSCKKVAKCGKIGTCDALVCSPSHKCEMNPGPTCVKTIFTEDDIAKMIDQLHADSQRGHR